MGGIFLCALVVRLVVGLALVVAWGDRFPQASDDGASYDAAARWLLEQAPAPGIHAAPTDDLLPVEPDPAARWPAGYWLLLASVYAIAGHQFVAIVALQALLGAAGTVAAYAIARALLPRRQALLAGYLVATSSTLVYLSASLNAEALYVPLLCAGLWLAYRSLDSPPGLRLPTAAASGVAWGLAEATRPLALPVFLAVLVWLAVRPGTWHLSVRTIGMLLLGFAVVLAPFLARDLAVAGRVLTFTAGGAEAFHDRGLGEDLASLGIDPYGSGVVGAMSSFLANPGPALMAVVRALPERVGTLFLVGGWGPWGEPLLQSLGPTGVLGRCAIWLLAALGLAILLRQRRDVAVLTMLAAIGIVAPTLVLGLPLVRYRAPADPLFLIWTTAGVAFVVQRLRPYLLDRSAVRAAPPH